MRLDRKRRKASLSFLPVLIILSATLVANGQRLAKRGGQPESFSNDLTWPQLLKADTDPTLRYPVARMGHMVTSLTCGWRARARRVSGPQGVAPIRSGLA
jgi:hypothetical protein